MRTIEEIQAALRARGFIPGPLRRDGKEDGILGRKTTAALERMQSGFNLTITGKPDDATLAKLFPNDAGAVVSPTIALAPWYAEASRLKGLREVAGKGNHPTIIGWAKGLATRVGSWIGKTYVSDDIAWCGLFVGHCIAAALPKEALPGNPLGAREWLRFGRAISAPALGAVAVFWRGTPNGWQGHVGFYAGESADGKSVLILGGNQSDSVSLAWFPKSRLLGYRWPTTHELPRTGPTVIAATGGKLSTNEA